MKVLIVGGGGREHALAWKAAQSPLVSGVLVAPGNAGTAREARVRNVKVPASDLNGLLRLAREEAVGLTIVGPEQPLVDGLVDRFRAAGLECFGPTAAAARLEGSKSFAKSFMQRHGIPTAEWQSFTDTDEALQAVHRIGAPVVIKADGLAAGKGVVVAHDLATAETAVRDMLSGNAFGVAGSRVVVEQFLQGEEVSFIALVSGKRVLALPSSQDHKARDDGDRGPNTGGMGAYSPAPLVDEALHARIMDEVMRPTVAGLLADGIPYTGFLYAGLMITPDGAPKVIEYNCRFGDPETQPIMMRLKADLVELCEAALHGSLGEAPVDCDPRAALGVVMTAAGYPGDCESGETISGLDEVSELEDIKVFHAATALKSGDVVTSGGRVLCVTALGDGVADAQRRAYGAVERIGWEGAYYRRDIGHRAVARERGS